GQLQPRRVVALRSLRRLLAGDRSPTGVRRLARERTGDQRDEPGEDRETHPGAVVLAAGPGPGTATVHVFVVIHLRASRADPIMPGPCRASPRTLNSGASTAMPLAAAVCAGGP